MHLELMICLKSTRRHVWTIVSPLIVGKSHVDASIERIRTGWLRTPEHLNARRHLLKADYMERGGQSVVLGD
jgi:hypothetical protein